MISGEKFLTKPLHKMVIIFLSVLLFGLVPIHGSCPDICECSPSVTRCVCRRMKETLDFSFYEEGEELLIENCEQLTVQRSTLAESKLKNLKFYNISSLIIEYFTFHRMEISDTLSMKNIRRLDVFSNAFDEEKSIYRMEMWNVNINRWSSQMDFRSAESIRIFHCTFEEFPQMRAQNVTSIEIQNCSFNRMETYSLYLKNVQRVLVKQTAIRLFRYRGLVLIGSEYIEFHECEFNVIEAGAIETDDVKEVLVDNCTISELKAEALSYLKAEELFTFSKNVIRKALPNSLWTDITPNLFGKEVSLKIESNAFRCDCDLAWLLKEHSVYKEIVDTAHCIHDQDTYLKFLTPVLDNETQCSSLKVLVERDNNSVTGLQTNFLLHVSQFFIFKIANSLI